MHTRQTTGLWIFFISLIILFFPIQAPAGIDEGEALYNKLSVHANSSNASDLFTRINNKGQQLDWASATTERFEGNLRIIRQKSELQDATSVYLLRKLSGEILILALPDNLAELEPGSSSAYSGLDELFKSKLMFNVLMVNGKIDGTTHTFARLSSKPEPLLLDRLFKISIILMLFFVMVGMGMTLTVDDFTLLFKYPKGIIVGEILQFGIMPLLAVGLGYLMGFHTSYPFIFVGMVLITAIPGGVTSNLMTYYAKGDLALSISLTSFSTVLSIFFTPLLLALYCANMPDITIPVKVVIQTIMILVIIPLILGMGFRKKWPKAAQKATPFFSALGIIALLVLIGAGILGNLSLFADTARYGLKFYSTIFTITMSGMLLGIVCAKIVGINNYQSRAISLETGLRNSALAMTIALLIQDSMGDFYSSMFVTSGLFGLIMYLAGIVSIVLYPYILPMEETGEQKEEQSVAL
ncbi:MAG: bile acid:sodium symporter family protein [Desulfobacterales bacterium]|nr:bile acid:sodium symporter family protein [Desulfobacterales bacterium]